MSKDIDILDRIAAATCPPMSNCKDCQRDGHPDERHNYDCTKGPRCLMKPAELKVRETNLRYLLNEAAAVIRDLRNGDTERYNLRLRAQDAERLSERLQASADRIWLIAGKRPECDQ